jgi:hypothetical protein
LFWIFINIQRIQQLLVQREQGLVLLVQVLLLLVLQELVQRLLVHCIHLMEQMLRELLERLLELVHWELLGLVQRLLVQVQRLLGLVQLVHLHICCHVSYGIQSFGLVQEQILLELVQLEQGLVLRELGQRLLMLVQIQLGLLERRLHLRICYHASCDIQSFDLVQEQIRLVLVQLEQGLVLLVLVQVLERREQIRRVLQVQQLHLHICCHASCDIQSFDLVQEQIRLVLVQLEQGLVLRELGQGLLVLVQILLGLLERRLHLHICYHASCDIQSFDLVQELIQLVLVQLELGLVLLVLVQVRERREQIRRVLQVQLLHLHICCHASCDIQSFDLVQEQIQLVLVLLEQELVLRELVQGLLVLVQILLGLLERRLHLHICYHV